MNHFKVVACLSQVHIKPGELDYCRQELSALSSRRELQQEFFDYCYQWKLAPWMQLQLSRYGLEVYFDEHINSQFEAVYQKTRLENEQRNAVAVKFLKAFHENNIEVII